MLPRLLPLLSLCVKRAEHSGLQEKQRGAADCDEGKGAVGQLGHHNRSKRLAHEASVGRNSEGFVQKT